MKPQIIIIAVTTVIAAGYWHFGKHADGIAPHNMHAMSMDLGVADANFDLRFLDGMTPHHQGAITMATAALQNSQRPEIKKLATEILKAQEAEISQMQAWRQDWYPNAGATLVAWNQEMGHMMAMSDAQKAEMAMDSELGVADANFDLRFINAMIPHHEGALIMAKAAQAKTNRPEIKKLAQNILSSQQTEIAQMQKFRQAWYGK